MFLLVRSCCCFLFFPDPDFCGDDEFIVIKFYLWGHSLWKRIKTALKILFMGEASIDEVVITKRDTHRLVKFLKKTLKKEYKNEKE